MKFTPPDSRVIEQVWAIPFLLCQGALIQADGEDLDVGFGCQVRQFVPWIAAVVVAAIGDNDKGLARRVGFLDLHQPRCTPSSSDVAPLGRVNRSTFLIS
jgi:hypothetical protein